MKIFSWTELADGSPGYYLPALRRGSAAAIGGFDGPHRGHETLFRAVLRQRNLTPGIITFRAPPRFSFTQDSGGNYTAATLEQRLRYFKEAGFAFAVVIDFSPEFSRINGRDFISILHARCNLRFLAEGADFHFGYKGSCGISLLHQFAADRGIVLEIVRDTLSGECKISSSRIRAAVSDGDFELAAELLGRNFELDCGGISWNPAGGGLVSDGVFSQVIPKSGCYRVRVRCAVGIVDSVVRVEGRTLYLKDMQVCNIGSIEFVP